LNRAGRIGSSRAQGRRASPAEPSVRAKFAAARRTWTRQPGILQTHHRIILGDARNLEGLISDVPIHLVVTSPPYWDLKKYPGAQDEAQLGNIRSRHEFLGNLSKVWRACFRLLMPGGRMCVVVGDVCRSRRAFGRHVVEPLHAHIQTQCQEIGFDPLAPIIWSKIANVATEVTGNGATFLGKPYEPNAVVKNDIEFILSFRKPGDYRHPSQEQRLLSLISKRDHRKWFRQIWSDVPGEVQRHHPAPFPKEIARRLISMFSFVGDTVLDPFCGTGTTTLAAMETHRASIGVEIERQFIDVAMQRVKGTFMSTVAFETDASELTR
jgi:DNA modification methylase